MKNEVNTKRSNSMKEIWATSKNKMMASRERNAVQIKAIQSEKIKKHYLEHPEHRTAISIAQKNKWVKYKKALTYCVNAGIKLE